MKQSAGFILFSDFNGITKFLLLRCYNYWDFAKGHREENETLLETAYRETKEEANINKEDIVLWHNGSYTTEPYAKPSKTATYYLGLSLTHKIELLPNPVSNIIESHEYRWATYDEAKLLCNERIGKALDWANNIVVDNLLKSNALFERAKQLVGDISIDLSETL